MGNKKKTRKLVLSRETLRNVTGAAIPPASVGCPSGLQTHCGCSGINSCGVVCGVSQRGPSCGWGASVCICPSQTICPSAWC